MSWLSGNPFWYRQSAELGTDNQHGWYCIDGHSAKYTVKVAIDESGTKLTATGTYSEDDSATFKNVKKETEKKKETKKSKLAKTGDLVSPYLPQLTMLGSAFLGSGVILRRRKRRH